MCSGSGRFEGEEMKGRGLLSLVKKQPPLPDYLFPASTVECYYRLKDKYFDE